MNMAGTGNETAVQYAALTTVDNQRVEGVLNSIDDTSGKITLRNVSINKVKMPGLHYFYASNIKDLELTHGTGKENGTENTTVRGMNEKQKERKVAQHKKGPMKDGRSSNLMTESPCHVLGEDSGDQGIGSADEMAGDFEDFYQVDNYMMFCRTCDKFRDSITYLMSQDTVAVTFYGVDVSRKGTLSLIQVATEVDILMYDVLRLGYEGFVDGLQAFLESRNVLKVIHDCRMVSDALFHQYEVNLSNVFDTQVAGVFAYRMNNGGDFPRFVESLPLTLMSHLGLKDEDVHHFFSRDASKQGDEVWLQRPLCSRLLQNSMKNLVHMIPLHHILQDKLMMEFRIGVQLYLDEVRDRPRERVDKSMSLSHLLPYVFQDLPKHVASASKVKPNYRSTKSELCRKVLMTKGPSLKHDSDEGEKQRGKDPVRRHDGNRVLSHSSGVQIQSPNPKSKPSSTTASPADRIPDCSHRVSNLSLSNTVAPTASELCHRLSPPKNEQQTVNSKSNSPSLSAEDARNYSPGTKSDCPSMKAGKIYYSPKASSTAPSADEVFRRLLPSPKKQEAEANMIESDSSSVSEGYLSSRSAPVQSALMCIPPPTCSSASSVCSDFSDAEIECAGHEIECAGQDARRGYSCRSDLDVDTGLNLEMSKNILQQARRSHFPKSDIKKLLLPAKARISPKSHDGSR